MSKAVDEPGPGVKRVYIDIKEEAFNRLADVARNEKRSIRQQAAWDIEDKYIPKSSAEQGTHP